MSTSVTQHRGLRTSTKIVIPWKKSTQIDYISITAFLLCGLVVSYNKDRSQRLPLFCLVWICVICTVNLKLIYTVNIQRCHVCSEMLSVKSVMITWISARRYLCVFYVCKSVFLVISDVMIVQVGSTGCLCMCSCMCTCLLLSERHNCLCREGKCQTMLKQKQDSSSEVNLQHTHKLFVYVWVWKGIAWDWRGLAWVCLYHVFITRLIMY